MLTYFTTLASPLGELLLTADDEGLTGLYLQGQKYGPEVQPDWCRDAGAFHAASEQLAAYFDGGLRTFDLALSPRGTEFQQRVWRALLEVRFGHTESYASLARRINAPTACRAVGHANGRNPISIIVPCHRLLGTNGSLTGYAGGIERKRWLLAHEKRVHEKGKA